MTQPEALRLLIEDLELNHEYCPQEVILEAAAELRRLYAQRDALLKALKELVVAAEGVQKARAAIAKAEGEKT